MLHGKVHRKVFADLRSAKCVGSSATEECRRLHNKELYELYCLANIIRVIKLRRMTRVGNLTHMGERRGA